MAYFAITYDLVKNKDYQDLINVLEDLGAVRAQLSFWLLDLDTQTATLKAHLAAYVDEDDKLMVIRFTDRPRFTRAFTPAIDWIKQRFG